MIDRAFRPDPRAKLALLLLWAVAVFLSPGLWFEALMMLLVASVPASLALAGVGGAEAAVWGYRAAFALSAALSLAVLIVAVWKIR